MTSIRSVPTTLRHFLAAHWRWRMLTKEGVEGYQLQRAQRIIEVAYAHSPFYRCHWQGYDRRDWQNLPLVDKTLMNTHFEQFNTRGISYEVALQAAQVAEFSGNDNCNSNFSGNIKGLTAGLSSGTSGQRGLFLLTDQEIAAWAGVILARTLHHIEWRGYRVAFFLRSFSNLYAGVDSPLLHLRYFDLNDDLMLEPSAVVQALNELMPQVVIGPPSLLDRLAVARQRGTLRMRPQRLIAVAEVLEPQDQRRLAEIFDARIEQIYQATEGLLAVTCSQGSLHLQEDLVAIQLEALATPPGEAPRFTPIVTDLWRTTQPIIRYRLGDVVQMSERPCPCGSPLRVFAAVEGRLSDICFFTTGAGAWLPFYPAMMRQMLLQGSPPIRDYELIQAQDDQLLIHLEPLPDASFADVAARVLQNVQSRLASLGCQPARVQIEAGLPARLATTKRRRVRREAV